MVRITYARSTGMASTCRGCGAKIKWIKLQSGKSHPVDPERVELGDLDPGARLITEDGDVFVANESSEWNNVLGYISHFATCPDAEKWRK